MKRSMMLLALAASVTMAVGCEADDSAPRHTTRDGILTPSDQEKNNAEHRALESPHERELPTGGGKEFPGQSRINTPAGVTSVIYADVATTTFGPADASPATPVVTTPTSEPTTRPAANNAAPVVTTPTTSAGTEPQAPATSTGSATPAILHTETENDQAVGRKPAGLLAVPGTGYVIDKSWGTIEPLKDYPHRPNADSTAFYSSGVVLHNPLYFYDPKVAGTPNDDTFGPSSGARAEHGGVEAFKNSALANFHRVVIDSLWFGAITVASPALWFKDCPVGQRHSEDKSEDPTFRGSKPATGAVANPMIPGKVEWQYPPAVTPDGNNTGAANNGQMPPAPADPFAQQNSETPTAATTQLATQPATQP